MPTTNDEAWFDGEPMTAADCLDNARVCIQAAEEAGARDAADMCYAEAEGWLRRALHRQGFSRAKVRLKARAERKRRPEVG